MSIHPSAVIDKKAELGRDVHVGPFAVIGDGVRLGSGCKIHAHAMLAGKTILGDGNEVFPYAFVGAPSADKKALGGEYNLCVGARNTFREYSSIHGSTSPEGITRIGDDNLFLQYAHVAHDCEIGNKTILSSLAQIAGHVSLGDGAYLNAKAGVAQHLKIGSYAMVSGATNVRVNIEPFLIFDRNKLRGVNTIGMQRGGFEPEAITLAKAAYTIIFKSGYVKLQALEQLRSHPKADTQIFKIYINFLEKTTS